MLRTLEQINRWFQDLIFPNWEMSISFAICSQNVYYKKRSRFERKNFFLIFVYLCIDLGSLIGNPLCGRSRIFLPLRFCVKSILSILKPPKTAILTFWTALNFSCLVAFDIFKGEISPKIKIQSLLNCSRGCFWPSEISQNWFHVNSECQENC